MKDEIKTPQEKQTNVEEIVEVEKVPINRWADEHAQFTEVQRKQRIINLTVQARTRLKRGQYDELFTLTEELLYLDPDNANANSLIRRAKSKMAEPPQ